MSQDNTYIYYFVLSLLQTMESKTPCYLSDPILPLRLNDDSENLFITTDINKKHYSLFHKELKCDHINMKIITKQNA